MAKNARELYEQKNDPTEYNKPAENSEFATVISMMKEQLYRSE